MDGSGGSGGKGVGFMFPLGTTGLVSGFGRSVAWLGDADGGGLLELAVGCSASNGATEESAVAVLFRDGVGS